MFNIIVGTGAVGAALQYGSGSDQKMRLLCGSGSATLIIVIEIVYEKEELLDAA
jgi:hypothetical protein